MGPCKVGGGDGALGVSTPLVALPTFANREGKAATHPSHLSIAVSKFEVAEKAGLLFASSSREPSLTYVSG